MTAAAISADPGYNGLNPLDVSVINIDNDTAGITVSPTFGLTTTESGGTATFTIVLNSQPTADVTIGLSSSNTSEGTVSPASVTFTTANWNTPQTVTVTGVNDLFDDGDVVYSIVTAPATSSDGSYNGLNALDVSVSNTDDDTAGITLTPTSGLITTEAGGTATFTVVLTARPTANVTIGLISSDTTEGTVNQASVTFTSDNWNTAQTVTITGVNDALDDGDIAYDIVTTPASSSDSSYNGLSTGNVSVTNTDNDEAGITVTPTFGLTTTEAGGTATFTVVLTSQPTADVTIGLSSSDTTEGTVSPSSLTFTAANWNTPRTVTVTGVNDVVDDGDISYAIVTAAATSSDPNYNLFDASNVLVTNADNDVTGITVTPSSGLTTTEAGGTATYTIALTSQPAADVTIALSSTDTAEGTVTPASLTFTPANWNIPQTVTVTGVNDAVDDGDIPYNIINAPATSADASYNGLDPIDVAVTNADGDTAGIIVTPITGRITTEGRRHDDLCGHAPVAADRRRHDWPELGRYDRRHRQPVEPHLHGRQLERGADRDGDRRQRRPGRWGHRLPHRHRGGDERRPQLRRVRRDRRAGDQHRRRHGGNHRHAHLRSDDHRSGRHRDVHGGAQLAADRGCDDRPDLEQHGRRHRQSGEPRRLRARTGTRPRP